MAEPINLAPIRVHAVSVPMRPHPTHLHKFHEMMLQANGDDTVQADIFGTDPQGNPSHKSFILNEQGYEQLRKELFDNELATMPPFSSLKSGNTIGRVVGETAPAEVPASQANPPIEAETDAEKGWWDSASPWVHGGLDVLGFLPGLGAIPDLINAGIYAAEGDAVNASLSAVAAIPFAGDAIKGGVLVGRGSRFLGKKSATNAIKETSQEATKHRDGAKVLRNENAQVDHYSGKLRGKEYQLPGVKTEHFLYVKRPPADLKTLRNDFNNSGRSNFLKNLSSSPDKVSTLKKAGFNDIEISKIQSGKLPNKEWQVHHIKPLDDGGTNTFNNLTLIKTSPTTR